MSVLISAAVTCGVIYVICRLLSLTFKVFGWLAKMAMHICIVMFVVWLIGSVLQKIAGV